MKDRIICHIVETVTRKPKKILWITLLVCVFFIVSSGLFMEFDLTFKGLIGSDTPVIRNYQEVIQKFSISGVTTVALEPSPKKVAQLREYHEKIDTMIVEHLDQKDRTSVLKLLTGPEKDRDKWFNDREQGELLFTLLTILDLDALEALIARLDLTDLRRELLLTVVGQSGTKERSFREARRILQSLSEVDQNLIFACSHNLSSNQKNILIKRVLHFLTLFEKKQIIKNIAGLSYGEWPDVLARINEIEEKIETDLTSFKLQALEYADELKNRLVGDKSEGRVVSSVLYSDELSISEDQQMYLLMVSPQKNIDNMANAKEFVVTVDGVLKKMGAHYDDLVVRRTGYAAVHIDVQEAMFSDFGLMMFITFIGIFLVFLIGLRSILFPLLSMIPLVISIIIMFGAYSLFGSLNFFSMMTPIILFGLGIDYAIHIGARYGEVRLELGPKVSASDVLTETYKSIGPGLFVASMTTVFAFLAMNTSTVRGFAESGLMAATGVIGAFLAMVYVLPVLIIWQEKSSASRGTLFLESGTFELMGRLSDSVFGVVVGVSIIVLALVAFFLPPIEMERDGMKLTTGGVESVELRKDLEDKFNFSDAQTYFIIDGYKNLKKFRKELARKENGEKVYPWINPLRVMDARKGIRIFEKLGWDGQLENLSLYRDRYAVSTSVMGRSNKDAAHVYDFIVRNYVDWDQDRYLVVVPPAGYVWDSDLTELYMKDLSRLEKIFGVQSSGPIKTRVWLLDRLMGDLITSSLTAFFLIFVIILVTMRSFRATLICSLTLLICFLSTLSLMSLFGMKLTFATVMAFPLVVGLGIDYIVHMYHRLSYEDGDTKKSVSSTGKAVLLTTLTTLMAFGTISFSINPGLAQMGQITCIGLVLSLLGSLFLLPLVVKIFFWRQYRFQETSESSQV